MTDIFASETSQALCSVMKNVLLIILFSLYSFQVMAETVKTGYFLMPPFIMESGRLDAALFPNMYEPQYYISQEKMLLKVLKLPVPNVIPYTVFF